MGEDLALSRVTPADAFRAARANFRQGERLDMVKLAQELGVARTTLYRWTGGRDQLLADVVWAELHDVITHTADAAPTRGAAAIEYAVERFLAIVTGSPAMRAFLANEGESGIRAVTAPRGLVRPRLVELVQTLIQSEIEEAGYRAPAPAALLADGIVTLTERYLHNGGDPSLNPNPVTACQITKLLLREPCA
jgi:AcrR family transcriptional regulator